MNAAAEQLASWLIMGRPDRSRRARRRQGTRWRRHLRKLLINISLGFLLVGCSGQRPFQMFSHRVVDPIGTLRTGEDPGERIVAYNQLSSEPQAVAGHEELAGLVLVEGFRKESSPLARAAACKAMRHYNNSDTRATLLTATKDSSPMVRAEAASSLGFMADDSTIDILAQLAKTDSEVDVRVAATKSLASLKDPKCNAHLVECLRDRDYAVADAAGTGLRENTGADLASRYEPWKQYLDSGSAPDDAPRIAEHSGFLIDRILR